MLTIGQYVRIREDNDEPNVYDFTRDMVRSYGGKWARVTEVLGKQNERQSYRLSVGLSYYWCEDMFAEILPEGATPEDPTSTKEDVPSVDEVDTIPLSEETENKLISQMVELYNHYYGDVAKATETGVRELVSTWKKNKAHLYSLLRKNPNWSEKDFAIIDDWKEIRNKNRRAVDNYYYFIKKHFIRSDFFEKYKVKGLYEYREICNYKRNCGYVVDALNYLEYAGKTHILIDGMNKTSWIREKEKWDTMIHQVKSACNYSNAYSYEDPETGELNYMTADAYHKYCVFENIMRVFTRLETQEELGDAAEQLNKLDENIKARTNNKTSKTFGKICRMYGIDKLPEYNRETTVYCDAMKPLKKDHKIVASIHPCDYITSSFGDSWTSCHTIDKENLHNYHCSSTTGYRGCYSAGTTSYMLDESTIVVWTYDPKASEGDINHYKNDTEDRELWMIPKHSRNLFHYVDGTLIQGRLYPFDQTDDGNECGDELYKPRRAFMQKVFEVIYNLEGGEDIWTKSRVNSDYYEHIGEAHYHDVGHYPNCNISRLKFFKNKMVYIGHAPICTCCGNEYDESEQETSSHWTVCDDCRKEKKEIWCEYHQRYEMHIEDDIVVLENGDRICRSAYEANTDRYVECEYCHGIFDIENRGYAAEDGSYFCSSDCRGYAGYVILHDERVVYENDAFFVESRDAYYSENEVEYCESCNEWVLIEDFNAERQMCNSCVENENSESEVV